METRERAADAASASRRSYAPNKSAEEQLRDEITRLRAEGSRLLEEEQQLMQQQLAEEMRRTMAAANTWNSAAHRIKIKWTVARGDETNGGYTAEMLEKFLQKYGDIEAFVMSKKAGSAMVEYRTQDGAEMAVEYEQGRMDNPITLQWIGAPPKSKNNPTGSTTIRESDYESVVLRQMRQAEERKRLIEQMMKDDE